MPRAKLEPFFAPRPSAPVLWLLALLARPILRWGWQVVDLEIAPADEQRLRDLRGTPALLAANHPSLAEPLLLYHVLRRAGVSAFVLTAWDTMTGGGRSTAALMQRFGAYSVRRGRADRPSMEMTERLLQAGERILVFPEGQTYGLNDVLLPFQEGLLLMGFRAADAMGRRGADAPLLLVPLAVKYVYTRPMAGEVEASLARLETSLDLAAENLPPYDRLRRIAASLIERLERDEHLDPIPDAGMDARINLLRQAMVSRLAVDVELRIPPGLSFPQVVQLIANAFDDLREQQTAADVTELRRRWLRLKNFIAVRDDYVAAWPSAERFADVLARLEVELLGKSRIRGPRRALIRVGEPIDLRAYLASYQENRREAIAAMTNRLEGEVAGLLRELGQRTAPLTTAAA